ncbi:MAG TPA: ThuA domain-containing protein [Fimbriiglobus sp.]|jgi:nicotinamidase-related amidase/type 1 glutamine amidotransferase
MFFALLAVALAQPPAPLTLHARTREEAAPNTGRYHAIPKDLSFDPKKTALVICDMWDRHWCTAATNRVAELAPRINEVANAARAKGVLIIHCPSDTMDFYKDHPGRKLAQAAPKVEPKVPLERWCKLDDKREGMLPIDDADGGCHGGEKSYKAWTREHPAIEIKPGDGITDSEEAYYLMRQRGIENVLVCGVHANMCVLGRPFSIRQMVKQGMNVVLLRDLTDTMYDPAKSPYVSHFTGTDLVVEHIEKYWCPSALGSDIVGGKEFRFKEDKRPLVAIVMAEDEYDANKTLPAFALAHLGRDYRVSLVFQDAKDPTHLPGIGVLDAADAMILYVRRKPLQKDDMEVIKRFVAAGKPIVALRTCSHAFAAQPKAKLKDGAMQWTTFDEEVLGCHYTGHYGKELGTTVKVEKVDSPILKSVPADGFKSTSWLYKSSPLAAGATVLMTGTAGNNPPEPVAWTWERKGGGKVFYTCLGHQDDFKSEAFVGMVKNAVMWSISK